VVTTKEGTKPVYVSSGHLVSLATAVRIVEHFARGSRIPEPLAAAHRVASEKRNREMEMVGETLCTSSGDSESKTGCL
jgi:deoxyribonuclease V